MEEITRQDVDQSPYEESSSPQHTRLWQSLETLSEITKTKDTYIKPKSKLEEAEEEIIRLQDWISDLQKGMYVNCIYCGHRYPPGTPDVRDKVLYDHIKSCPKHPLYKEIQKNKKLLQRLDFVRRELDRALEKINELEGKSKDQCEVECEECQPQSEPER